MHPFKLFFILMLSGFALWANDNDNDNDVIDEVVVDKLKIEANHNVERLKSFRKEVENNRIFGNEREKGLGEYLEDQEKFDLIRERGLREYLKNKAPAANMDENSDEYKKDQKEKQIANDHYEKSREIHVRTRNKIHSQIPKNLTALEEEELQIFVDRPRYDIRNKRKNKWATGSGKPGSGGSMSSAPGFQNSAQPPAINDFVPPPPPPDFPAAPAPYEGFEELPPPPMYDSNMNTSVPYDPSFGDMAIPPPPPPPPDYNF